MSGRRVEFFVLACCFFLGVGLLAGAQDPTNQGKGTILGTVIDPTGIGIPGVRITVLEEMPPRNYDVTTDCSGFYRLSNLAAGRYTVRFGSKGFRTETRTVLINAWQVTPLDLKMQVGQFVDWGPTIETWSGPLPTGSITGTVMDGHGAVIPGAHVLAIEDATGNSVGTTTNADGLFSLSGVGRGTYTVRVEARGFKTEIKRSVRVEAEASIDFHLSVGEYSGPIVIPEPMAEQNRRTEPESVGAIQGTVLDGAGAVPTRITAVNQATGKRYETTTDSNGAYRFRDLTAGTYCAKFETAGARFEANWPRYETSKEVTVKPHSVSELNVTIPAPREIVEVCSASCTIETIQFALPEPAERKIALQVYAVSNFAKAGSELWITITLANTSKHSVFIREERGHSPAVDYQIYAFGTCDCPGLLKVAGEPRRWSDVRVKPGGTVVERVDLSKLMNFGTPGTYMIVVGYEEKDSWRLARHEVRYQPFVRSNPITMTLVEDTR